MPTPKQLPSGKWRVRVYIGTDEKGKQIVRSITANTKKEAAYKAAEFTFTLQRHEDQPLSITVGEAIDRYIESNTNILAPDTVREYRSIRKNRLQTLMGVPLDRLTQEKITRAVNIDAMRLSPKTIKNAHGLLSAVLNVYHPNFTLKTSLPKKRKYERYIPTDADIALLLHTAKGSEMYLPILLSATLSLRRSEVCGLLWTDVDLKEGKITIRRAVVINDQSDWVTKDPKTYDSYRKLSIPQVLADELSKQKGRTGPVVNLNPGQITNRFRRMLSKLEIPSFRFHDLRHYNASVMLALKLPDKYAMARGGWADINTLKKIYQHINEEKQSAYDPVLSDYFNRFYQKS